MSAIIRDANEDDLPAILAIHNDILLKTTAIWDDEAETLEARQNWFAERRAKDFPVLVAETENQISGFASYGSWRSRCCYKRTVEHTVHVHRDFRGHGIGKGLMLRLLDIATTNGMHVMVGGMTASNETSRELHRKLGFVECGHVKQVGFKFGKWLDLLLMQKILG